MKYILTTIILFATILTCSASENLLPNGDFEQRNRSWKFDSGMRVVASVLNREQYGTKILEVRLNQKKSLNALNEFDVEIDQEITGFIVTMDIKVSEDFQWEKEGGALPAIQFKGTMGKSFRGGLEHKETKDLKEWSQKEFTVKLRDDAYGKTIRSYISVDRGSGKLWIDNITIVPITE